MGTRHLAEPALRGCPGRHAGGQPVGGYLIGIAVAWISARPEVSPEWRLFVVTGFLGGLTTFSTFSAESVGMLLRGDYGWATLHALGHLFGSLAMTALGIATYRALA